LSTPAGLATNLWEHLERYHIRERFELTDESGTTEHLILAGPQADAWLTSRCNVPPPAELLHHVREEVFRGDLRAMIDAVAADETLDDAQRASLRGMLLAGG
jgi:hypothetical protein